MYFVIFFIRVTVIHVAASYAVPFDETVFTPFVFVLVVNRSFFRLFSVCHGHSVTISDPGGGFVVRYVLAKESAIAGEGDPFYYSGGLPEAVSIDRASGDVLVEKYRVCSVLLYSVLHFGRIVGGLSMVSLSALCVQGVAVQGRQLGQCFFGL